MNIDRAIRGDIQHRLRKNLPISDDDNNVRPQIAKPLYLLFISECDRLIYGNLFSIA